MLYIIRHGQTDWNVERKLQGQTNIPLNKKGIEMAKEASIKYKDVHFDICFCSSLDRAKETAKLLLENRNIPLIFDDRLVEMRFGIYEGAEKTFDNPSCPINLVFEHPELYKESIGGSETFEHLFKRINEFLNECVYPLLKENKDILIVGHGCSNLAIVNQVLKEPLEKYWKHDFDNCSLIKLI